MMLDQSPFSSSTSDDSSMHFDDNDTSDTSISLPPAATDVMESLDKLRASVDQVQCEQFRRRDDAHNLRDILLVHIRDLEQKISARFDEQDRVHRALRKDMHDQKNLSSLDRKSTHQKLSAQIATAVFDTVDVRKEVKEINSKVTYLMGRLLKFEVSNYTFVLKQRKIISIFLPNSVSLLIISEAVMPKRGKVVATAPNHLLTIKADPTGEVVAVEIEQMNREVVLGKVVAEVEVREEVIGVDLPREDLLAVRWTPIEELFHPTLILEATVVQGEIARGQKLFPVRVFVRAGFDQLSWDLNCDYYCTENKNDLLEFSAQAQQSLNAITTQMRELVAYINRGGDNKKGESSSSRGPQPSPPPVSTPDFEQRVEMAQRNILER
ncbi:hypothetical protein F511_37939 [Dorcoceras hygrometricum]|uniref:Uncharacterized protein n=1 Tax=Dorcoceras hygrometricum TaxID=472368 RepID=A0A2Z7AJ74_9LAMI|nr:hypothetical protein F511_37939 [Dorcoceras hygrometricum]